RRVAGEAAGAEGGDRESAAVPASRRFRAGHPLAGHPLADDRAAQRDSTASIASVGSGKFRYERAGVGPRCPWYFEPAAALPYGCSAGLLSRDRDILPIVLPGHNV